MRSKHRLYRRGLLDRAWVSAATKHAVKCYDTGSFLCCSFMWKKLMKMLQWHEPIGTGYAKPRELGGVGTVEWLMGLTIKAKCHKTLKHSRDTGKLGNASHKSSPHPTRIPNKSASLLPKFKWMISVTHVYFMRLMGPIKLWFEILLGGFYVRVTARMAAPDLVVINRSQTYSYVYKYIYRSLGLHVVI